MQLLDGDAVAAVERASAAQEPDRGGGLLVGEDFGVGQAGGVVDRDVHELPADVATRAGRVGRWRVVRAGWPVTRCPAPR